MRAKLLFRRPVATLNELCQMRDAFAKLVPRTVGRDYSSL